MTSTPQPKPNGLAASARSLPAVVYFDGDDVARSAMQNCARYLRMSWERLQGSNHRAEVVVLVSKESQVHEHYDELRRPQVRVIALSHTRFSDPRNDGLVYCYLPPATPEELLERMLDNAVDHVNLLATRQEVNERLAGATHEIHELNKIGAALSAEHDTEKLLELILTKCREITRADAGSLYIVDEESLTDREKELAERSPEAIERRQVLRFKLAQNDTVQVPFIETTIPINDRSVAGYVALNGEAIVIEDCYHLTDDVPYSINRRFDDDLGYRTKSILAVPMRNQKSEIVGVVQLINAKRDRDTKLNSISIVLKEVVPFTNRQQEIVLSLASQAAVAYENSELYASIQRLFEGFVKAAVTAIESRDPTTSGHSFRVANLTVALAEAADRTSAGAFSDVRFSRNEMKEIRYASLLHDFGKVGVREEVLVKAKKLYPAQLDLIRQRFDLVRRTIQAETNKSRIDYLLQKGREEYLSAQSEFDEMLRQRLLEIDSYFETILRANEPTVMPDGNFDKLLEIAARQYFDTTGNANPLLTDDEVRLLSIRKGSLDDAERLQIESHVVHTYNFLKQIPWTNEIRNIPHIARGHHEKLNGHGYPYKLSAPEIPLQTRMMTVSDIFDALSAQDRPYKKAVTTDRALGILDVMVKDGEVDGDVYQLFLDAKVYEKWRNNSD